MNSPTELEVSSTALVPPPPRRTPFLTPGRRRILRSIAEALFWDGREPVPAERLDWMLVELEDYLAATTGMTRTVVYIALTFIQVSPPFSIWKPRFMTACSIQERLVCLERLEKSPIVFSTLLAVLTKAVLSTIYFEHPDAMRESGFDGTCARGVRTDGANELRGLLPETTP
jgi:hypothetical protein